MDNRPEHEDEPASDRTDTAHLNRALLQERLAITTRRSEIAEILKRVNGTAIARDLSHEDAELTAALFDVTSRIVKANEGLVLAFVSQFRSNRSPDDTEDFRAAGVLGLLDAINTYDMSKGGFGHWAYTRIQAEVLRAVRNADYPTMSQDDFEHRPRILAAQARLVASVGDDGRQPTFEEIASEAGATVGQVTRVLDPPHLGSLTVLIRQPGDSEPGGRLAEQSVSVDDRLMTGMTLDALQTFGLASLTDRELFVIVRRFGLDGADSQGLRSIGQMLGLSREAVRQIESKGLAKLQDAVTSRRSFRPDTDG